MKQITCPHCGDTYPDFDAAHVCSKGPYAPRLKSKMNERIKLLAKQAGCKVMDDGDWYIPSATGLEKIVYTKGIGLEKFAELIVEECLGCCEQVISDPVPESVDTWLNGGSQCINEIKQHFGVEE